MVVEVKAADSDLWSNRNTASRFLSGAEPGSFPGQASLLHHHHLHPSSPATNKEDSQAMNERSFTFLSCRGRCLHSKDPADRESQSRTLVPHINERRSNSSFIWDAHGADSLRKASAVKNCGYFKTADAQTPTCRRRRCCHWPTIVVPA